MRALVLRFVNDQSAATAIEYGLIAAGFADAIIAVVNGLGTRLEYHIRKRAAVHADDFRARRESFLEAEPDRP